MRTEPQAAVRSTLPEAEAVVPARVRAAERNAVPRLVRGEARTGEARSAARAATRRGPQPAQPAKGEWGEYRDEHGAQRRREEDAAVTRAKRSNVAAAVSVRHAAASEASCRASGARSDRREWRREGLQRKARSRSDAPNLIIGIPALVTIIGTIIRFTVCTGIGNIVTIVCTDGFGVTANMPCTSLPSKTRR